MAIVITSRASVVETGTASASDTSASFTPASSSKLYVIAWQQRNGTGDTLNPTCTGTHTGVGTYTRLEYPSPAAWNGDISFQGSIALFEAAVTTPSAGTVTVDYCTGTGTARGVFQIFDATGTGIQIKSGQRIANAASKAGGNAETHTSGTLSATTISGNTIIAALGCSIDAVAAATTPASWTALGTPQSAVSSTIGIWTRTGFAGTSVAWTDCGQLVGTAGAVIFELEESGGGPVQDSKFFSFF